MKFRKFFVTNLTFYKKKNFFFGEFYKNKFFISYFFLNQKIGLKTTLIKNKKNFIFLYLKKKLKYTKFPKNHI